MNQYLVATTKRWNYEAYKQHVAKLKGEWTLVGSVQELNDALTRIKPRYIFFPHWSWIVPYEIITKYECVCFHMTDLPYGRGGSPLQNLIVRGHDQTQLVALKMIEELDAGPIYMKAQLSLDGSAQEIYERAADKIYQLIKYIVENEPAPVDQSGDPVMFTRRTPKQSVLPKDGDLKTIYDHIRMLDAETYPRAFLEYGDYVIIFSSASLNNGALEAKVEIKKREE